MRTYHHAPVDAVDEILATGLVPTHHQQRFRDQLGEEPPDTLAEAVDYTTVSDDHQKLLCRATAERILNAQKPSEVPERDGSVFLYPESHRHVAERVCERRDDLTLLAVNIDPEMDVWQARSDLFGRIFEQLTGAVLRDDHLNLEMADAVELAELYWGVVPYNGETTVPLRNGAAFAARPEVFVPQPISPERVEPV